MATLSNVKPMMSPIATDPTGQKLAELEGRIAALEGALSISPSGAVTLKSVSTISIESASSMSVKATSAMTVQASGTMTLKGAVVNIN